MTLVKENRHGCDAASYDNFSLCDSVWESALEIYNSESETHATDCRTCLSDGFGSVNAAAGNILFEAADLAARIAASQTYSRKQRHRFENEIDVLDAKAECFESVTFFSERHKIAEMWQSEYPFDTMHEIDVSFRSVVISFLTDALEGYRKRSYTVTQAGIMQRICWYLEQGK